MGETGKTLLILISSFFLGFYIGATECNNPKAIEVYQGKTTLEYKIIDGIKIDSVVIYKNEK